MQSCRCVLSCQITQGGPETADHLVSGCYGNKLKRRKASCTHPIRRKRLVDPQIPPNPSPKPPCCNACPPARGWSVKSLLPQTLTATAKPSSRHGAICGGPALVACWVPSSRQLFEGRVQLHYCSICSTSLTGRVICTTATEVSHSVVSIAIKVLKGSFLRVSCKILSPNLG